MDLLDDLLGSEEEKTTEGFDPLDGILGPVEKKKDEKSVLSSVLGAVGEAGAAVVSPSFYGGLYDAATYTPEIIVSRLAKVYDTLSGESLTSLYPTEREKTIEYLEKEIAKGLPKEGKAKLGGEVGRSVIEDVPSLAAAALTPGGLAAKTAVGVVASAAPAGLSSRFDFLKEQRDFIRDAMKRGEIEDFTQKDWDKVRETYSEMANYFGAAEAVPAALGAVIQIPLFFSGAKAVPFMKPIAKKMAELGARVGTGQAASILRSALSNRATKAAIASASAAGTELTEEVATQILQSAIDAHPDIAKREKVSGIAEAIEQVGAQAILAGGGMQAASEGGRALFERPATTEDGTTPPPAAQPDEGTTAVAAQSPGQIINQAMAGMSEPDAVNLRTRIAEETGIIVDDEMDIDDEEDPALQVYVDEIIRSEEGKRQEELDAEIQNLFETDVSEVPGYGLTEDVVDVSPEPESTVDAAMGKIETPTPAISRLAGIIKGQMRDEVNRTPSSPFMRGLRNLRDEARIVQKYTEDGSEQNIFAKEVLSLLDQVIVPEEIQQQETQEAIEGPLDGATVEQMETVGGLPVDRLPGVREPAGRLPAGRVQAPSIQSLFGQSSVEGLYSNILPLLESESNAIPPEAAPVISDVIDSFTEMVEESKIYEPQSLFDFFGKAEPANTSIEAQTEAIVEDVITSETYVSMNEEMSEEEYYSSVSSGEGLRPYSILSPEDVSGLVTGLNAEELAKEGKFKFDNIDITEFEYISHYDNSLMDAYLNGKASLSERPAFSIPSEPLIFKSLGQRLNDVYDSMREDQKAAVDAAQYTELDYIRDFYPDVLPIYEEMVARSGTTIGLSEEIEAKREQNKDKSDMVSIDKPRRVMIKEDDFGVLTATMSFRGVKNMGYLEIRRRPSPDYRYEIWGPNFALLAIEDSKRKADKKAREILKGAIFNEAAGAFYTEDRSYWGRLTTVSKNTINGSESVPETIEARFGVVSPGEVPLSTAQQIVNKMLKTAGSDVTAQVVAKVSDLPQNIIDGLPQTPKGKYLKGAVGPDGKIYIVSENMADTKDVYMTLVHELSHKGFDNLVKKIGAGTAAYDAFMVQVMSDSAPYRAEIEVIANDYGYDTSTKDGLEKATIEWLSYRSEKIAPSLYRRFKNALNRFFRSMFGVSPFTTNDIDALIDMIRDQTNVGNTFYAMAFNEKPSRTEMPESAEERYTKGQKTPNDSLTAVERAFNASMEWLGKITNKSSWLSQFGIDTTKSDMLGNQYSIADDILRRMTESSKVGVSLGTDRLKLILEPLGNDTQRYDLFSRYIYTRDIKKDIELGLISKFGENTRHGFESEEQFNRYFDSLELQVQNSPDVSQAVSRRDEVVLEVFDALRSLKLIPAETLRDPRYFHHAVLKYMDTSAGISGKSAKRVKSGAAKGRTGTESESDIYLTSYMEAEGEYLIDAFSRIYFNQGLNEIGSFFDVKKRLNAEANALNKEMTIDAEIDQIKKENPGIDEDYISELLADMPMARFSKSIATIISGFQKLRPELMAEAIYESFPSLKDYTKEGFVNLYVETNEYIKSLMPGIRDQRKNEGLPYDRETVRRLAAIEAAESGVIEKDIIYDFLAGKGNFVTIASTVVRSPYLSRNENLSMLSRGLLSSISKRKNYMRDVLGENFNTHRSIVKGAKNNVQILGDRASERDKRLAEYTEYNPAQNLSMYYTTTANDFLLNQAMVAGLDNVKIEDLKKALAIAAPNNWVIPEDLADGLNNFQPYDKMKIPEAGIGQLIHRIGSLSRFLLLFSPENFSGYFGVNALGDFNKAAVFFPKAVFDAERNARMMKVALDTADGRFSEIGSSALYYRVLDSGMYMRDIEGLRDIFGNDEFLYSFLNRVDPKSDFDKYATKVEKAFKYMGKYTDVVSKINQIRENFQRLVVYDYVLEKANEGEYLEGVTPEYIREGVKRLGNEAYAARIARDAIGDYGNLSENGLAMRNTLVWFYGFIETNNTAYFNFFRNAAIRALPEGFDGNFKNPSERYEWLYRASLNISKNAAMAAAPAMLLIGAAAVAFPDEVEEIMDSMSDRGGPLVIPIGKKDPETGYIPTVSYADTFFDFLSWIGIENPYKVGSVVSGQRSPVDVVVDAPIMGAKKMLGSMTGPLQMTSVVTGQAYFPDIFNPIPIERDQAVANMMGLGGTYQWVTGKPKRGAGEVISMLPRVRYVSPGEASYRYTQKLVNDIRKKNGMSVLSFDIERSPRDYAKYMYRKSIQYGDKKSADRWLQEFIEQGGKKKSLRYDMKTTDPFSGLRGTGVSKGRFLSDLNPVDRKVVLDGEKWWKQFYGRMR